MKSRHLIPFVLLISTAWALRVLPKANVARVSAPRKDSPREELLEELRDYEKNLLAKTTRRTFFTSLGTLVGGLALNKGLGAMPSRVPQDKPIAVSTPLTKVASEPSKVPAPATKVPSAERTKVTAEVEPIPARSETTVTREAAPRAATEPAAVKEQKPQKSKNPALL